eukprot:m.13814 g.13814  ORF g.13814 m.13814 type:complete len:250 (+) comp2870_c0_seq1:223-972(+)
MINFLTRPCQLLALYARQTGSAVIDHLRGRKLTRERLTAFTAEQRELLGIELHVHRKATLDPAAGPYLFVLLNQNSLAESCIMPEVIPFNFKTFANIGYLFAPFVGWMCWMSGAILVIPGFPLQTRTAVARACEYLRSSPSHAMYMSIEGRRSPDGQLSAYRHGCSRMAIATGATIIPIFLAGAREILPYGDWRIRPGHVHAWIDDPIPTSALGPDSIPALTQHLRSLAEIYVNRTTDSKLPHLSQDST